MLGPSNPLGAMGASRQMQYGRPATNQMMSSAGGSMNGGVDTAALRRNLMGPGQGGSAGMQTNAFGPGGRTGGAMIARLNNWLWDKAAQPGAIGDALVGADSNQYDYMGDDLLSGLWDAITKGGSAGQNPNAHQGGASGELGRSQRPARVGQFPPAGGGQQLGQTIGTGRGPGLPGAGGGPQAQGIGQTFRDLWSGLGNRYALAPGDRRNPGVVVGPEDFVKNPRFKLRYMMTPPW